MKLSSSSKLIWILLALIVFLSYSVILVLLLSSSRNDIDVFFGGSLLISHSKELYAPSLRTQLQQNNTIDYDQNIKTSPLIHIVSTRFMQEQHNLTSLAKARLELFRSFCLPSIVNQKSQNFIWIIKIDPELDIHIVDEIIKMIKPFPNFFLIASNINYDLNLWWGEIESKELFSSKILFGNGELLKAIYKAAVGGEKILLETRLDADDGLHRDYLNNIQYSATAQLFPRPVRLTDNSASTEDLVEKPAPLNWIYWCAKTYIDWFSGEDEIGKLFNTEPRMCVTPGLTLGIAPGADGSKVPRSPHQRLAMVVYFTGDCGAKRKGMCIQKVPQVHISAIRSRTLTSAGMAGVNEPYPKSTNDTQTELWQFTEESFGISKVDVRSANAYLNKYSSLIAEENLRGQCTPGHSCKNSTQMKLKKVVSER